MFDAKEITGILKTGAAIMVKKEIIPAIKSTLIFCFKMINTIFLGALLVVPSAISLVDILVNFYMLLGAPHPHNHVLMHVCNVITLIFAPLVFTIWIIRHIYRLGLEKKGYDIKTRTESNRTYKCFRRLIF